MFSFDWVAPIRRETNNVKGGIPGSVTKNKRVLHSWQDFRGRQCSKKEETTKHLWSWALGVKGGWSNGEMILWATETRQWQPFSKNIWKLKYSNAVIRNQDTTSNSTWAKDVGMIWEGLCCTQSIGLQGDHLHEQISRIGPGQHIQNFIGGADLLFLFWIGQNQCKYVRNNRTNCLSFWWSLFPGSWMGVGHQKHQTMIRSFPGWNYVKLPVAEGSGVSRFMSTSIGWEGGTPQLHGDRDSCTWNSSRPYILPYISLLAIQPYPLLYNKPVNISISLNSVQYSSKWSNPKRRSREPSIYSQVIHKL